MSSFYAGVLSAIATLVIVFVPIALLVGTITLIKRRYQARKANPLTKNLLRPAGYSLQKQIFDKQLDLFSQICVIPLIVTLIALQILLMQTLTHRQLSWFDISSLTVIACIAIGYEAYQAIRSARTIQRLRLGHDCEMAVGQELEHAIRPLEHPFRIYHDIPFPDFNIDHLVIGKTGVFVIETKGRSKPVEDGDKQFKVRYENNALHFPNHVETKPLEQTKAAVESVRRWLSEATGFDVPVAGILVLPGWYVELKQRPTCTYVVSGSALPSVFNQLKVGSLEFGQVKAISYQVEQRVRDVTSK